MTADEARTGEVEALERLADQAWNTAGNVEGRERVHEDRETVLAALAARRPAPDADTGNAAALRAAVEALADEWETAHGDPPVDPSHISVRHAKALHAVLDAAPAPTEGDR